MIKIIGSGLFILLLLSGCGWNGTPTRHNDFVPLTSIKIVAAVPAIEANHTIAALTSTKLTVIGDYSGLFNRDITDQATWSSGNTNVANFLFNISPNQNRVSGIAAGTATLTATVGSISATYSLTVSSATISSIAVSSIAPSVSKGLTTQFTATGTFSDSTSQDLTFDANWTLSPGTFATISNDPSSKGLATASAIGDETITASFGISPKIATASTTLTVTAPTLKSIAVTPANSSITGSSKTVNFSAVGTYSDGTTADITSTATWGSSQTSVATIATGGLATTVAVGTTSISATLGGISGSTNFTVGALVLSTNGLQINPVSMSLVLNGVVSGRFTVKATFTDGTIQDVTASSEWSSNFPTVASVNNIGTDKGLVTGVSVGSPTITATYGGQSVFATVTVQ